jgi:hypothetical protein
MDTGPAASKGGVLILTVDCWDKSILGNLTIKIVQARKKLPERCLARVGLQQIAHNGPKHTFWSAQATRESAGEMGIFHGFAECLNRLTSIVLLVRHKVLIGLIYPGATATQ